MRCYFKLLAGAMLLAGANAQAAVLSGNLVQGGDFEDTSYLKTFGSLDSSNNYVPVHRFNQEADLGMWLAKWGPPSQDGGYGGFSLYDDPRDVGETGGDTRISGDLGNVNRSVDPLNPGNHILEPIMFRPRFGQWIEAPANHVPGPISFSFDYMIGDWINIHGGNWGTVWLMGLNQLPVHDLSYTSDGDPNAALTPLGGDALEYDGTARGDVLMRFAFGDWQSPAFDAESLPFFNTWHTVSSENPDPLYWGDLEDPESNNVLTADLGQTYPYYAIIFYVAVYTEAETNFWLYSPDSLNTDTFAQGFDNFVVQLSVEDEGPQLPEAIAALTRGDFELSGNTDTEDINPFILALTDEDGWKESYVQPFLGALWTEGGIEPPQGTEDIPRWIAYWTDVIIDQIDPSLDGQFNTEDINPFICWLTGGSNCAGGGAPAIIPEPASLALLGMGALALIRRRR